MLGSRAGIWTLPLRSYIRPKLLQRAELQSIRIRGQQSHGLTGSAHRHLYSQRSALLEQQTRLSRPELSGNRLTSESLNKFLRTDFSPSRRLRAIRVTFGDGDRLEGGKANPGDTNKQSLQAGLYLVATPIGNLEDITLRALRVLKQADLILAEDTRHSAKLLNHHDIKATMYSLHEHNEALKIDKVLQRLQEGLAVALISDAGTPLVSDPGIRLVKAAIAQKIQVFSIPGPSAVLSALAVSGLPPQPFTFCGFLPSKAAARIAALEKVKNDTATLIFFMPPHKALDVLQDLQQVLGGSRQCAIARELTKVHEEVWRGAIDEACKEFAQRAAKGEFTIVIEGCPERGRAEVSDEAIRQALHTCMQEGALPSAAAKTVASQLSISRNRVYDLACRI